MARLGPLPVTKSSLQMSLPFLPNLNYGHSDEKHCRAGCVVQGTGPQLSVLGKIERKAVVFLAELPESWQPSLMAVTRYLTPF